MSWLIDLFNTIIEGFNAIVDMLILVHDEIVNATTMLEVSQYGLIDTSTVIFKSISAFRYVIGSYLFNIFLTFILFGIAYATFTFIKQLKELLFGDKGAFESSGIAGWFSKIFAKG